MIALPGSVHPGSPFEARLATSRLRLRRLRADDLDAMVELDSDPQVMRWLSGGTATPREFIEEVVLPGFLCIDPRRPWLGVWATEDPAGGFLGWVSLRAVHPEAPRWASLGYRLCRTAWGRGLATEAAAAVLHQAFHEGDLERVEATVYEQNHASCRVLEKLGLRVFRRHRLTLDDLAVIDSFDGGAGEVWEGDDLTYRLERADWHG
ncbi:MAG: GNAT family N-acetyltransferase [Chloroflexota bacterium]